MKYLRLIGICVFLGACLYLAGNSDLEEAQRAEAEYIERVCLGVHSDYRELGADCGGVK